MMRRPLLIAATALSLAAVSPSQDRTGFQLMPETGVRVDVSHDDSGATLVSVQAREVSARVLMGALAEHIGLEVSGFDRIDRDPKVSAVLVARPFAMPFGGPSVRSASARRSRDGTWKSSRMSPPTRPPRSSSK